MYIFTNAQLDGKELMYSPIDEYIIGSRGMKVVPENILTEMAAAFGAARSGLTFLGGGREDGDGIVYAYTQGEHAYALKILAIEQNDLERAMVRIEARLRFANYIGEAGVRCAYPLALPDGTLFIQIPHGKDVFLGYRMHRFYPGSEQNAEHRGNVTEYGRLIGRMHRLSKTYPFWWNMTDYAPTALPGWAEELNGFYNWCADPEVKEVWQTLRAELSCLPANRGTHGFIHNDPQVQNILFDAQGIVLLDFDVANCQFFMTDIMIAAQGVLFSRSGGMERPCSDPDALKRFYHDFLDGYEQENHVDTFWLTRLDLFIQYRRALLFTVMQDSLKTKPDARDGWKNMLLTPPQIADQVFTL